MKALIIDDERLARKELAKLLADFPEVEIIGEASNADEAIDLIKQLQPELLFLDIQMPGKTGFELLASLDKAPNVIFTTAYDEYALKAFEVNALDYLLKPIVVERLAESLKKLEARELQEKGSYEVVKSQHKLTAADQVFVKDGEKCWFVKLGDIRLFESDGNYVKVYFEKFKPMIHKSLNNLDERLDERDFFRASRKHIINLKSVQNIEHWFNGGLMVTLTGGEKIELSRRQAVKFKDMMSL
ncbi:MAG TPA: LytTR family transcriptional regulator DNA-binding domain-containing protein [Cytophagales bacterium]|nr:LytTR family transcriptional regulator DNA-binding domain-containing protein [Cytophagales bacterium]